MSRRKRLLTNLRKRASGYGIPTMYRGVRFRSRLEARWAVFFDHVGWPWAYEPFDLEGYVPDFVLRLEAGELLVEIKPELTVDPLWPAALKIDQSGWDGEALVLGSIVFEEHAAQPLIGLHREMDRDVPIWDTARMFSCLSCGQASVLNTGASWRCRVCGDGFGNEHVGAIAGVAQLFAAAGNRVQWRPST